MSLPMAGVGKRWVFKILLTQTILWLYEMNEWGEREKWSGLGIWQPAVKSKPCSDSVLGNHVWFLCGLLTGQGGRIDAFQLWACWYQPKFCQHGNESLSLKAQYASYPWSPCRNTGPTKNESKALTRTGGLICQTPVRCCHQKCWGYSFIDKECQPELKIRSIVTPNYLNLMIHDSLVCGIKIECDIFVLQ